MAGAPALPALPAITLPKGGGALRGLGEKLTIGPTGSASFTVPLPISQGRSPATTPALELAYDSAAGNGPFGLGWRLSLPAITRKTENGLPRYRDAEDSDTFVLAGAEDLVPARVLQGTAWVRDATERDGARVERYRPRVERGFHRIERWTDLATGLAHWRTTSPENTTTIFGRSAQARIADPADPLRTFAWLIEEVRDDRGNLCAYDYVAEDVVGVADSPAERNRRGSAAPTANRYLKRVRYANAAPEAPGDWHFELVFDYGDHDPDAPSPQPDRPWPARADAFSSYRPGFELRTYRLCRRALMFHRFAPLGVAPQLVRSLDLAHDERPAVTTVTAIAQAGYVPLATGYARAALPALELAYTRPIDDPVLQLLDAASLANLPVGLGRAYQWVDLDSEGLAGVLCEQAGAWFYKRNLGGGALGALEQIATTPAGGLGPGAQLLDVAGDGTKCLVTLSGPLRGYYRRTGDPAGWTPFVPFASLPVLDWDSATQRMIDLDGDGRADVLVTEDEVWSWYPSLGAEGFGARACVPAARDEERGPVAVFADASQTIFLADASGDGLVDLVRIRSGEICYWPNLGYGRFGAKVTMANAPVFDHPDLFDPRRIRLADLDGTGTADLLYLGRDEVRWWTNQAGNAWSAARTFGALPRFDDLANIAALDFLGNGTSCLVWSSPAPREAGRPLAYLDLMGGSKPYLLARVRNNLAAETTLVHAASTKFYLADRAAGQPWATRLPFPLQVVERVEQHDLVTGNRFATTYSYHHGHYDGIEQELRGFARVDQIDRESYALPGIVAPPPTLTRTWYHTGAVLEGERLDAVLAAEYWQGDGHAQAAPLPAPAFPGELGDAELAEAHRALRGQVLRRELYALDETAASAAPYRVTAFAFAVQRLQPRGDQRHAVMFAHPRETLDLVYERAAVPDPRVTHELALAVDALGVVRRSASIAYPRRGPAAPPVEAQAQIAIVVHEVDPIHVLDRDWYRVGVALESRDYEAVPAAAPPARYTVAELDAVLAGLAELDAGSAGAPGTRRMVARDYRLYARDDLSGPLAYGGLESRAVPYERYHLAFTPELVTAAYGDRVTPALLVEAGYVALGGAWWIPSGVIELDPAAFYQPVRLRDPFGNVASIAYDAAALLVVTSATSADPVLRNVTTCVHDYRTLTPAEITDPNGNRTAIRTDALGLVTAIAALGKLDSETDSPDEIDSLDEPTARFTYDFSSLPISVRTALRERHGAANPRWQESYEYSDGFGRIVQRKLQAEPDPISAAPRWVGSGRTVFDARGRAVVQYEPFFSATSGFEGDADVAATGVASIVTYDALGRAVHTAHPDGTVARVVFAPWQHDTWDRNDTVLDSAWYAAHVASPSASARRAAELAARHAATPTVAHLDPLGRTVETVVDRGAPDGVTRTRTTLDLQDRVRAVVDHLGRTVAAYGYPLTGARLTQRAIDGGDRWVLSDLAGKPVREWDGRDHARRVTYDLVRRPTHTWVATAGGDERLCERIAYGEALAGGGARDNLRGRPVRHYDGAGVAGNLRFDLDGNLALGTRQLATAYATAPDWTPLATLDDVAQLDAAAAPLLEPRTFATAVVYDALRRPIHVTSPDLSVAVPTYNAANLLERLEVTVHGAVFAAISNLDYDAKGQRTRVEYGGGVQTRYGYEPTTFRLSTVTSQRTTGGGPLQALSYTYDPTGNLVEIVDAADQTAYFANGAVDASTRYEYDAAYVLRRAEGRELVGIAARGALGPEDAPVAPAPADAQAVQRYVELFDVDAVGNLRAMRHAASQGSWTRTYTYGADSNRLVSTGDGAYHHDAHGNLTAMPHLAAITWDDRDRMASVDLGGGGTAYCAYDAAGQRIRKVLVSQAGAVQERIYLGGCEIYRERAGDAVVRERETLHVMDGAQRAAVIDTVVRAGGAAVAAPAPVIRYQLTEQLGSSVVELDAGFALLSYEQYYAYGGTAYRAGGGASDKRYRFTGKERDAETGLYYHGARYYAAWLGRWTAADPAGLADGPNGYVYARGNPRRLVDPGGKESVILGTQKNPADSHDGPQKTEAENKNFLRRAASLKKRMVAQGSKDANVQAKPARTGAEVLDALKAASATGEIKNFVTFGHSYVRGLFMHNDAGFYRSAAAPSADDRAKGARTVGDLKALIDSHQVRFARDAVAVFASCGCGGHENFDSASFAADFTKQTGVTSIAAIGLTWPGEGNDNEQKSAQNQWVKIERKDDGAGGFTLKTTQLTGQIDPLTFVTKDDAAGTPAAPPPTAAPPPQAAPPPPAPPPPVVVSPVGQTASGTVTTGSWLDVFTGGCGIPFAF